MHFPIPPPTRAPARIPVAGTMRLELKNKTRRFIWDLVQDFILFWDVSWTCSSRSLSHGLDLLHLETSIKTSLQTLIKTFNVTLILFPSVFFKFIYSLSPHLFFFWNKFFDQKHNLQENGQRVNLANDLSFNKT
jgi:hypothetical protein